MKKRSALTLIELCVSLAIAAGVVAAVLSATASIVRQDSVISELYEACEQGEIIRQAIEMDFIHAESVSDLGDDKQGVQLQCLWSMEDVSAPKRTAAKVRYELRTIANMKWLCRIEQLPAGKEQLRLVASNVEQFELTAAENSPGGEQTELSGKAPQLAIAITQNGESRTLYMEGGGR